MDVIVYKWIVNNGVLATFKEALHMRHYTLLSDDRSFAFSAENPTGARGGGSRGGDCTKLSPTVTIKSGETVTLAHIHGSGMIQAFQLRGQDRTDWPWIHITIGMTT